MTPPKDTALTATLARHDKAIIELQRVQAEQSQQYGAMNDKMIRVETKLDAYQTQASQNNDAQIKSIAEQNERMVKMENSIITKMEDMHRKMEEHTNSSFNELQATQDKMTQWLGLDADEPKTEAKSLRLDLDFLRDSRLGREWFRRAVDTAVVGLVLTGIGSILWLGFKAGVHQ
jgi:hypothetical protein